MARARNIKPAFFTNDELAEIPPIGRLLFIGLWTLADCNGNIEWREKRIKAQILPYDECNIRDIMINLDKSGFIRFYSDGHSVFLNITNFEKHQNPHKNEKEKGSDIPKYCESMRQVVDFNTLEINTDKIESNPDNNGTNPADSLILIPESLEPIEENDRSDDQSYPSELVNSAWEHFWAFWKQTKTKIGKKDTTPKGKTYQNKWKPLFNRQYFKTHSEQDFKDEINLMIKFCKHAHSIDGFNRFENMQIPRFLSERQWRD